MLKYVEIFPQFFSFSKKIDELKKKKEFVTKYSFLI